jgi:hypothetical protein
MVCGGGFGVRCGASGGFNFDSLGAMSDVGWGCGKDDE